MINIRSEAFIKKLGHRIVVLRHQKELSQEELANLADIPVAQVGRIERGKINCTVSSLRAIANALEIHLSELFDFKYE